MNLDDARKSLRRGLVFHAWHDGSGKFKFGVILNGTWPPPDDVVLFVVTTSQLDFFANGRLDTQILRIPGGKYAWFPKDTIVDFRRVWPVSLLKLVNAEGFATKGDLDAADRAACDQRVRGALQLTGIEKKQCLP